MNAAPRSRGAADASERADANLFMAAALWQGLVEEGVRIACVCPGSRSTPLAVAAHHQAGLEVLVHLDERSAGFYALGAAKAGAGPVALVCTSGTAAANFLPAVVEASLACVPLVVLTADRPPELRDVGAAQTIDQVHLFGSHVRWFHETPAPGPDGPEPEKVRAVARRAVHTARRSRPGPVHWNLPFREPLSPSAEALDELATPRASVPAPPGSRPTVAEGDVEALLAELATARKGLIVAGPQRGALDRELSKAVSALAEVSGFPVWAELPSQLRFGAEASASLAAGEALLRCEGFAAARRPDVVLRVGGPTTSKALPAWLARHVEARVLQVAEQPALDDPALRTDRAWDTAAAPLLAAVAGRWIRGADAAGSEKSWTETWRRADEVASGALRAGPAASWSAGDAVATAFDEAPADSTVYLSNSLSIRLAELYAGAGAKPLAVLANRGANGIDGLVSSALGASHVAGPVLLVTGDLAFLHDVSGLAAARRLGGGLVVLVLNDGGGGIFDHLPIASRGERVGFEALFRTPHGHDLAAITRGFGLGFRSVADPRALGAAMREAREEGMPSVVEVVLDPAEQKAAFGSDLEAVSKALTHAGLA